MWIRLTSWPKRCSAPVVKEERTLSDGSKAMCYVFTTRSRPQEHAMGPWAPRHITDDKDAGGIWFKDGEVYDVDGPFVKNLATLYGDAKWKAYRDDGTIRVTETREAFEAAARPDVDPEYQNYVVEGQPEWVEGLQTTYVIPVSPVYGLEPTQIGARWAGGTGRPRGAGGTWRTGTPWWPGGPGGPPPPGPAAGVDRVDLPGAAGPGVEPESASPSTGCASTRRHRWTPFWRRTPLRPSMTPAAT